MIDVCIIGAGPAGLMAASIAAKAGCSVLITEAKPSVGRKFLMAGKSGLNLTKDEPHDQFCAQYEEAEEWLRPMLDEFGKAQVCEWARNLGQEMFTGSSRRVFPTAMKASPLLRAWLAELNEHNVKIKTRHRWLGWENDALLFNTPDGAANIKARTTILALGGGSWRALGSDGLWSETLASRGIEIAPFKPSNMGFHVPWSKYMEPHFGKPIKSITATAQQKSILGEFVISKNGVEGSAIYALSKVLRNGATLQIDLLPDVSIETLQDRLSRQKGKASRANIIRKVLKLNPEKTAVFNEFSRDCTTDQIPKQAKNLTITPLTPHPIDEAISTAGGVLQSALNKNLMLKKMPSVFCAGEMLDWEAPTGGYLITACLATGRWAGLGAVNYLASDATADLNMRL